jgi:Holliday junction resolvase
LKQSLEKVNRKVETTRIENWSVPGVPDVLCCNERGDFSFLELKIVKKGRIKISAHQVSWLARHSHARCFIVTRSSNMDIDVYYGSSAVDLCVDRTSAVESLATFEKPYDWQTFWSLTCGDT